MQTNGEHRIRDHESDPAHNAELGHEWVDEGGASHLGPATHIESGHAVRGEDEAATVEAPETGTTGTTGVAGTTGTAGSGVSGSDPAE